MTRMYGSLPGTVVEVERFKNGEPARYLVRVADFCEIWVWADRVRKVPTPPAEMVRTEIAL